MKRARRDRGGRLARVKHAVVAVLAGQVLIYVGAGVLYVVSVCVTEYLNIINSSPWEREKRKKK